ncbi:hypothetical protein BDN72DRAFT_491199 [Pluteus cervinus]|uniref:Uncharacterized protein n=1 Tax=Pluteus cervinus TaxID=181527 RepID=A0ACD3A5F7_9AGAR|nr:hypothetical protein BDN72DRAFT_491199 [Pluteus cervinus]
MPVRLSSPWSVDVGPGDAARLSCPCAGETWRDACGSNLCLFVIIPVASDVRSDRPMRGRRPRVAQPLPNHCTLHPLIAQSILSRLDDYLMSWLIPNYSLFSPIIQESKGIISSSTKHHVLSKLETNEQVNLWFYWTITVKTSYSRSPYH